MITRDSIEILLENSQKVFDVSDLARIWGYTDFVKVKNLASYYKDKNKLFRVAQGIYSTTNKPDMFEVAQKLQTPSYITYHTALTFYGINFQFYSSIHCFSNRKREVKVFDQNIIYHQVKLDILFNSIGVEQKEHYNLASKERAICDSLYISPSIAFDNLKNFDRNKLLEISQIYENKRVEREVQRIIKNGD